MFQLLYLVGFGGFLLGIGFTMWCYQKEIASYKIRLAEARQNDYSAYIKEAARNIEETVKLQGSILKLAQASEKYGLLFTSLPERKG